MLITTCCGIYFTKIPYMSVTSGTILPHDFYNRNYPSESYILKYENNEVLNSLQIYLYNIGKDKAYKVINDSTLTDVLYSCLLPRITPGETVNIIYLLYMRANNSNVISTSPSSDFYRKINDLFNESKEYINNNKEKIIVPSKFKSNEFQQMVSIKNKDFESEIVMRAFKEDYQTTILSISNTNVINSGLLCHINTTPNNTPALFLEEKRKHIAGKLYYVIKNEASIFVRDDSSYKYERDYAAIWYDKNGKSVINYRNGFKELAVIGLDGRGNVYVKSEGKKIIVNQHNFQNVLDSIISNGISIIIKKNLAPIPQRIDKSFSYYTGERGDIIFTDSLFHITLHFKEGYKYGEGKWRMIDSSHMELIFNNSPKNDKYPTTSVRYYPESFYDSLYYKGTDRTLIGRLVFEKDSSDTITNSLLKLSFKRQSEVPESVFNRYIKE